MISMTRTSKQTEAETEVRPAAILAKSPSSEIVALGACLLLAAGLALAPAAGAASPTYVQTLTLDPGWNAIYLEVDPDPVLYPDPDPEVPGDPSQIARVFSSLPAGVLESVWRWSPSLGRVDFVQDPSEGLLARDGWRGYFPEVAGGTPFLSNLFSVRGNQAYLVHLAGATQQILNVTGTPTLRRTEWVPDSFNLVGFHVDPGAEPTLATYLQPSPAHAGQPVYNLNPSGVWELMPSGTSLSSGRSYWVYTDGPSEYQGLIEVQAPTRDGLEYGSAISTLDLTVFNRNGSVPALTVYQLASADGASPPVLARWQLDAENATTWPLLPTPYSVVGAFQYEGETIDVHNLPLAVRRAEFAAAEVAGLLAIKDALGSRVLVPVSASGGPAGGGSPFAEPSAAAGAGSPYTGLWVGKAVINAVSEVQRNVKRYCPCPGGPTGGSCPAANDGSISACQMAPFAVPPPPFVPFDSSPYFCPNGTDSSLKYYQLYNDFVPNPIPDAPAPGLESILTFGPEVGDVATFNSVNVAFSHPFSGELDIDLESPNGTIVRLHSGMPGDPGGSIENFYPPVLPDGPGSVDDFVGTPGAGAWKLRIADNAAGNTGELSFWGLGIEALDLSAQACQLIEQGNELPVATRREFELRLLLHSDDSGTVKLLKEATIMFQEGPNEATPGQYVLVANDERLSEFTGSSLRDGVPVGIRLSTVAYDFTGSSLALTGGLAPGQTLAGILALSPTFATNPFLHKYHPDHNALNELSGDFLGNPASPDGMSSPQRFEEFEIRRAIELVLAAADPMADPDAGDAVLKGVFRETLSGPAGQPGLHRQPIVVEGTLELRRVSTNATIEE